MADYDVNVGRIEFGYNTQGPPDLNAIRFSGPFDHLTPSWAKELKAQLDRIEALLQQFHKGTD